MSGHCIFVQCLALSVFLAGGVLGCVICSLAARFRRKKAGGRTSMICFLLTIIVALLAALVVFGDWQAGLAELSPSGSNTGFYLAMLAAGILVFGLYKVLVPLGIVAVLGMTSLCLHSLSGRFGQQQSLMVLRINESSYSIDDFEAEADISKPAFMKMEVCVLPETLLLPLPRVWFEICRNDSGAEIPKSSFSPLNAFYSYLYSGMKIQEVALPYPLIYPDVYSVRCTGSRGALDVEFVKAF